VAVVGYLLHARKHPAPLLDLSLMRLPCFGVALTAMMLFRTGIGAIPFLLPMMLQVGFGKSAVQSGLITFASSAGALVMKPATQHTLRLFGFRDTLVWNGVISAVMIAICAAFRPTWPAAAIYAALLIGGFFRSLQFTSLNAVAYADVPQSAMSRASSFSSVSQQLSGSVGIAFSALVLQGLQTARGDHVIHIDDFKIAFVLVALLTASSVLMNLRLARDAGDEVSGYVPARADRRLAS